MRAAQRLTSRGALRRPRPRTAAPERAARPVLREPIDRSPEHAEPSRFIPHVQGLRAIAVLAVVLYHFWPARFSGGYVGVDIFFVISGFLITAHLMRELTATGTVRLGQFWARRARRLLPASLLVLLFCALVAMSPYLTPTSALPNEVREILASTFYVENWYLALNSADYLNHAGDPTTVQHYWSLSLEEQFYVMWPLHHAAGGMDRGEVVPRRAATGGHPRARLVTVVVLRRSASSSPSRTRRPRTSSPSGGCGSSASARWSHSSRAADPQRDRQLRARLGGHRGPRLRDLPLRRADAVPGLRGGASDARGGRGDRGIQHRAVVVPDAPPRAPARAVRRRHLVLAVPVALAAHHHRPVRAVLGSDDLSPGRAPGRSASSWHGSPRGSSKTRCAAGRSSRRAGPSDAVVVARGDDRGRQRRRASPGWSTHRRTPRACARSRSCARTRRSASAQQSCSTRLRGHRLR